MPTLGAQARIRQRPHHSSPRSDSSLFPVAYQSALLACYVSSESPLQNAQELSMYFHVLTFVHEDRNLCGRLLLGCRCRDNRCTDCAYLSKGAACTEDCSCVYSDHDPNGIHAVYKPTCKNSLNRYEISFGMSLKSPTIRVLPQLYLTTKEKPHSRTREAQGLQEDHDIDVCNHGRQGGHPQRDTSSVAGEMDGRFFWFCKGAWRGEETTIHCDDCRECQPEMSWNCYRCNRFMRT